MGMEGFAASPMDDRLQFDIPGAVAAAGDFSPGTWRIRASKQSRRKAGMWHVWDGRNDVVAAVYNKTDAQLLASSKALLLACVGVLKILRPLALEGRLTRAEMARIHDAVEVVRRVHLISPEVVPTSLQENAKDIDLDPAFRTWCAQQYHAATAQGQYPASRSELRERYLRGER